MARQKDNGNMPDSLIPQTGIATTNPQAVMQRYLDGEDSVQIAESLGITRQRLSFWLLKHAEQEWKDVQVVKAIDLYDKALAELSVKKSERDPVDLAYARENLRSAQWSLERVCRRIYGQDQPIGPASNVQINIGIPYDALQQSQAVAALQHPVCEDETQ